MHDKPQVAEERCPVAVDPLSYDHSPVPIRDDLAATHKRAWARLGAAGEWFTAAERVAIARETRAAPDCAFCTERKAALSPYAVTGSHDAATDLPPALVDTIHRIRTDASRLTRRFYDEAQDAGVVDSIAPAETATDGDARGRPVDPDPDAQHD